MIERRLESKVVLLGDACTEKSAVLYRYYHGMNSIVFKDITLILQDTAGEEKYQSLIPMYIRGVTVAILFFSLVDENSFINVNKYLDILKQNLTELPILFLAGNKADKFNERVISYERCIKAAEEINAFYFEIDSDSGFFIDELFRCVARESFNKFSNLFINSIKCNLNLPVLESLIIDNPCICLEFIINGEVKRTSKIKDCNNLVWNETIKFYLNEKIEKVLKINIFSELTLIKEIEVSIPVCENPISHFKYDKDIFIKKGFFLTKKLVIFLLI